MGHDVLIDEPKTVHFEAFGSSPKIVPSYVPCSQAHNGSFDDFLADDIDGLMLIKEDGLQSLPILYLPAMHMIMLLPKLRGEGTQQLRYFTELSS